jgi:hypothetical protein
MAILVSMLCCGILVLWILYPTQFKELDTFKIVLLSISIPSPIWVVCAFIATFILGWYYRNGSDSEDNDSTFYHDLSFSASVICIGAFGILFLSKLIFNLSTGLHYLFALSVGIVISSIVYTAILAWTSKK